jgi:hypothetical protein
LEIEYTLTEADIKRWARVSFLRVPSVRLRYLAILVVMPIIGALVGSWSGYNPIVWAVIALVISAVLAPLMWQFMTLRMARRRKMAEALFEHPTTVIASETGVAYRTAASSSDVVWGAFARVIDTDEHVFLVLANITVIIVPKRAFADKAAADAFADLATRKIT